MRIKKKLAILAMAVAAAIPTGAFASDPPNFECPGGPPGHCKNGDDNGNGNGNGHGQQQQQQQQQQQSQSQSQCLISIAIVGDATCGP